MVILLGLGNVAFFKTLANGSYFKQIASNFIVGVTCGTGNISHMITSSEDPTTDGEWGSNGLTCDKFHLGKDHFDIRRLLLSPCRKHFFGLVEISRWVY